MDFYAHSLDFFGTHLRSNSRTLLQTNHVWNSLTADNHNFPEKTGYSSLALFSLPKHLPPADAALLTLSAPDSYINQTFLIDNIFFTTKTNL